MGKYIEAPCQGCDKLTTWTNEQGTYICPLCGMRRGYDINQYIQWAREPMNINLINAHMRQNSATFQGISQAIRLNEERLFADYAVLTDSMIENMQNLITRRLDILKRLFVQNMQLRKLVQLAAAEEKRDTMGIYTYLVTYTLDGIIQEAKRESRSYKGATVLIEETYGERARVLVVCKLDDKGNTIGTRKYE